MKKFKIWIMMLAIGSVLASCKKYLEKEPQVMANVKNVEQLQALLDNVTPPTGTLSISESNNLTNTYSTDDTEISMEVYKSQPTRFPIASIAHYTFDVNNIVTTGSDALWKMEYSKIFTTNMILSTIDEVTGDEASKNRVKATAYFNRAYSYWTLANYYCLPYATENLQSAGLPLKKTTDYTESLKRVTLKETYDLILADIAEAQKYVTYNDVQPSLRWRVSKPAIDAFLSRFYLFIGDYDKTIQFANAALSSVNTKLVDYKTIGPGTPTTFTNPTATLNYSALNGYTQVNILQWGEFYFTHFTYNSTQLYIPSDNLISLYDKSSDLRYKFFFIPNGGRTFGIITPETYRYTIFNNGRYLPNGPSIAEVLLNKAEAIARKGENVATAIDVANTLREKRMSTFIPLTATKKEEALKQILEERRRELPFAYRWWDIRRFSVNEDKSDDVTVTHTFFKVNDGSVDMNNIQTYTLPVKSRRYMVPINGIEVSNSHGQIEQNTY